MVVIWCWMLVPDWTRVTGILMGWALMALVIMDLRGTLLPDRLTLTLIPLGLFTAWMNASASLVDHLIGAVVGFAIGYAFVTGARRLGRRTAPGMGEAKLLAAAGAWVAWQGLPMVAAAALLAACLIGLWGRSTTQRPYADGRLRRRRQYRHRRLAGVALRTAVVKLETPRLGGTATGVQMHRWSRRPAIKGPSP